VKARAFWVEGPGRGAIREETLREPGAGEVRVRMLYSGVSRGTESLVFRGGVPEVLHQDMRCPHQCGELSLPVKYGYIAVGEVEAGAGTPGQAVFCLHPHQTRFVVPSDAVVPLPLGLPPSRAVLAPNLETALNGLWDGAVVPEHRVSVIGAGVVGTLLAWLLRQSGCTDLELVDTNPGRAETAGALGIPFATPDQASPDRDRVFHTSGNPAGLNKALDLCANEATIIELSWFGDAEVTLPLGAQFHARRLTIRASQVGQIAPSHRAEWTHRRRMAHVLQLLADHPELDGLIDGESEFSDLPETMARLAGLAGEVLCHRVCY